MEDKFYLRTVGFIKIKTPKEGYTMTEDEVKQDISYNLYNLVMEDLLCKFEQNCEYYISFWKEEWQTDEFFDYIRKYTYELLTKEAVGIVAIKFYVDGRCGHIYSEAPQYQYYVTLNVDVSEVWEKYIAEKGD